MPPQLLNFINSMDLPLCILTLNCWGIPYISKDRRIRMNAIAEELASGKYHIVTLQELWSQSDFDLIRSKTAKVLPYAHYFYSGVVGSGVCVLSSYRIIDTFFHQWPINGYIHRIQHGDWFGGKGVGFCKLQTDEGIHIHVYTAHLHAEYDRESDDYKAHRVLQAFETGKFIAMTSSQADITILGGDLNTEPSDLAYRIILGASGLRDSFNCSNTVNEAISGTNEHKKNSYTTKTIAEKQPEGKRIDYILYKGSQELEVNVNRYEHPLADTIPGSNVSYSDHEAVVTTLLVKKSNIGALGEELNKACMNDGDAVMHNSAYAQDLKDSITICNDAILSLDNHKRSYISLSVLSFVLLLAVIKMSDLPSLSLTSGLMLAVQMTLTIGWMFGLLMATLWNNIERNGIYAGKLSMEIQVNVL